MAELKMSMVGAMVQSGDILSTRAAQMLLEFVTAVFGATTEQPVFFQTLANDKGDPDEGRIHPQLLTREPEKVVRFVAKHDRNRRGMFFCTSTLAEGCSKRNKENTRETPGLHCDLDFKNIAEDGPTIRATVARLRLLPSVLVSSGGGLHAYWLFKEGLNTQDQMERIEAALRRLAWLLGGDPAVCEVSRLMRLPGTHNSKYGDQREVHCEVIEPGRRYELEELEEWLEEETKPLLTYVPPPAVTKLGAAPAPAVENNPFLAFGERYGFKPALDVEALLAAMAPGNVHTTQRDVSASLIKHGHDPDEVVKLVLDVTRRAVGAAGTKWNWRREERKIRGMTLSAQGKYPPKEEPEEPEEKDVSRETTENSSGDAEVGDAEVGDADSDADNTDGDATRPENPPDSSTSSGSGTQSGPGPGPGSGPGSSNVIQMRTKRKPKPTSLHIMLADAVIAVMGQRGQQLMFTESADHRYQDGLWHLIENDKAMNSWLNSLIEEAAQGLKIESTNKLIAETRGYILRSPALHQRKTIHFNQHGMVPTRSGLVNPVTGDVIPPMPEHYATWRIENDFNPDASCPWWLQMLEDAFADRSPESRALHIQLLQEILGMGLVDVKDKALSRALIFVGGSNYGKSGLIKVMAGLFGNRVNATSLDTLGSDNQHKTIPFAKREPWVLNEAFDSGKWHLSSLVKTIISGEPIPINMKGGKIFDVEYTGPIFWGSNSPPQFKEATDAIVNRIVVVDCKRKFDEDNPVGAAIEAKARGFSKPSDMILATEMEGVLAWAFKGLQRVLKRGVFVLPNESKAAAEQVRMSSNLVAEFLQECVTFNPNGMISTADFVAAHTSWWSEHKSDQRGSPASEKIGLAIRALADERIASDAKELRSNARRYYAGVSLNVEGKRHWRNTVTSSAFQFSSKTASTSAQDENPNQPIPPSWDNKAAILAMRVAHEKSVTGIPVTDLSPGGDRSTCHQPVTEPVTEPVTDEQGTELSREPRF